ncbi:MAG: ABC transporter ATP-binding protein [Nitrospinota bacterium]|nr:MAG: ABC transporter ATP-binding protein [Nitrospinota bacterium]
MGGERLQVLKGIDLEVRQGEMVGIVGASGVGKSTLLHLLGALDRPTRGMVYFQGKEVFRLGDQELAEFRNRHVGFIFQFHHLLPEFTALENTMLPALIGRKERKQAREQAEALLTELGLGKRLHHRPGELSGGEQQRVAVARALMNQPELVLADEPTGNLDRKTGEAIQELLRQLNVQKGQTFIIVTHNEKFASTMDRIFHLIDGKLYQREEEDV